MKPDTGSPGHHSTYFLHFVHRPTSSASSPLSQFPPGWAVLPTWVLRKKARAAGLHLSSASRSPTRHFYFPFIFDPRPHHGLLVFPLVTVLEEVASRLVSTTSSGRPVCYPCSSGTRPVRACPDLSW